MPNSKTQVTRLQDILQRLSDGVWEHGHGIVIENLDNPGWSIRIALSGTPFEQTQIKERFEERSENDWIHVRAIELEHDRFLELNCGPANLGEALNVVFDYLAG